MHKMYDSTSADQYIDCMRAIFFPLPIYNYHEQIFCCCKLN